MTWNTMKYREISEIFARFSILTIFLAILTMFLSIEFLQTWQLSKKKGTTFTWVLWNFYAPVWQHDLKHNEISWNQRKFSQICNLTKFLSIEFLPTWQLSVTSWGTTFRWVSWNFYVSIWRCDLQHNENWNIVKSAKSCQICNFNLVFVDRISSNLTIIKKLHSKGLHSGEFCEVSTCQSEDMTWRTRKYREISGIFARFTITIIPLNLTVIKNIIQ